LKLRADIKAYSGLTSLLYIKLPDWSDFCKERFQIKEASEYGCSGLKRLLNGEVPDYMKLRAYIEAYSGLTSLLYIQVPDWNEFCKDRFRIKEASEYRCIVLKRLLYGEVPDYSKLRADIEAYSGLTSLLYIDVSD
jgi:hypothetical protein